MGSKLAFWASGHAIQIDLFAAGDDATAARRDGSGSGGSGAGGGGGGGGADWLAVAWSGGRAARRSRDAPFVVETEQTSWTATFFRPTA